MALTQIKLDDEHELLHHFLHEHPLSITKKEQSCEVFCRICGQSSFGMLYGCDYCYFYLHRSCSEFPPTIQYPCHPCLLILWIGSYDEEYEYEYAECKMCWKSIESAGYCYRCEPCNFNIHIDCALLPSRMESKGEQIFQHLSHNHPLKLIEIKHDDMYKCFACNESSSSSCCSSQPFLVCCMEECSFSLHDSCFNLPQELLRPFHQHPLTLFTKEHASPWWLERCDACLSHSFGFGFHCEQCKFIVDVKCAFLRSTIDEGQDELLHFSHVHPLTITEKKNNNDDVYCKICGKCSFGMLYGCEPCGFYLHQSCTEFPQTLQHFYHPCLLTLAYEITSRYNSNSCCVCQYELRFEGFYYNCKACDIMIDIDCALLPSKMESQGQQQFHHFSHGHPLTLAEIELDEDEVKCSACQKCCSGQIYLCFKGNCKFSLHDSCFNLPQKIRHPFHPDHPLTLTRITDLRSKTCRVCYNYSHGFTYSCCHEFCDDFNLDVECQLALSTINYQGHHHNLLFIENVGPGIEGKYINCNACDTSFRSSTSLFHCMECYFFLHLECGPLPLTIQHESHMDPLILTDSPAIIDREDRLDTDVFYCDTCEDERDPRLPVYYCTDGCAYLAELKCVNSEVMRSLRGEFGEVELRSPIRHIAGRVISKGMVKGIDIEEATRQDRETQSEKEAGKVKIKPFMTYGKICKFLTAEESKEWSSIWKVAHKDQYLYSSESTEMTFVFSGEAYNQFLESLDSRKCESRKTWEYEKVINVGGHFVPRSLAPILEKLCAKYGDISVESTVKSSKVKMCCIVEFCGTLDSMYRTRVLDISDDLLFSWWTNLKALKLADFRVHFAFDRLKRVVDAYYGLSLKKKVKQNLEEIDEEISEVSQSVEDIKAKLTAQTEKLEALKERRKSTSDSAESRNSSEVSKCLKEASSLKWMIAGEGLL